MATETNGTETVRQRTLWLERRTKDLRDVIPQILRSGDPRPAVAMVLGGALAALEAVAAEARDDDARDAEYRAERATQETEEQTWGTEADRLRTELFEARAEMAIARYRWEWMGAVLDAGNAMAEAVERWVHPEDHEKVHDEVRRWRAALGAAGRGPARPEPVAASEPETPGVDPEGRSEELEDVQ